MFSKQHTHHFSFESVCVSERHAEERGAQNSLSLAVNSSENTEFEVPETKTFPWPKNTSDSHIYRLNGQGKKKLLMKHITSHCDYMRHEWPTMGKLNSKRKYPAVHFCSFSLDLRKICSVSRQCGTKTFGFLNFILCTLHLNVITSLNHLLMSDSAPLTFVTQLLNKFSHCYSLLKEELCLFSS